MPKTMEGLAAALLEAIGISQEEILNRIELEKQKHGWAEPPLNAVLQILRDRVSETQILALLTQAAADLVELSKTGKSRIKKDKSSLS